MSCLVDAMEEDKSIRYIGFPTITSIKHHKHIRGYGLNFLIKSKRKLISKDKTLGLDPAIFWYDSNHLCHVERYLQIYKPWKYFPRGILREKLGKAGLEVKQRHKQHKPLSVNDETIIIVATIQ